MLYCLNAPLTRNLRLDSSRDEQLAKYRIRGKHSIVYYAL